MDEDEELYREMNEEDDFYMGDREEEDDVEERKRTPRSHPSRQTPAYNKYDGVKLLIGLSLFCLLIASIIFCIVV